MFKKIPMTAVLLAGGQSSRMGTDKALLPLGEKTVLETLFEMLNGLFEQTLIVVNDKPKYAGLKIQKNVFREDIFKNQGPLGGLHAGFTHAEYPACFIMTCDMPLINEIFIMNMVRAWNGETLDALCAERESFLEPFPGIYSRENRFVVHALLEAGNLSMRQFLDVIAVDKWILPEDLQGLMINMNTREDYEKVLEKRKVTC